MADELNGQRAFICVTCGSQFGPTAEAPPECLICMDPRQFIGLDGQQWITLDELRLRHRNTIVPEEPGLHSIHTAPAFAIDQRAFLLQTPKGNVLWECVALLDQPTIEAIRRIGGVAAIAISHPHYYTTMVEWSLAFDNAPIHLHSADSSCVMRPHPNIRFWSGDQTTLLDDLRLIHTPGHFEGFQVLHWPAGAEGRGVLFSGDQPQVCMDRRWVSFMYSYPNFVPLDSRTIERIVNTLGGYAFDRIYGAFPKRTVQANAKEALRRSAERFIRAGR
jgi:hypothetical protein